MIQLFRRVGLFARNVVRGRYAPEGTTAFVIIYSPRTGSNYLASLLDSHPDILCHHEVFNPEGIHRSLSYKGSDLSFGTVGERDSDPWTFMRRVYGFSGGKRAVGFKIAPRENDWALASLLLAKSVRKVLLGRRSWLHAYTSGLIAAQTHMWSQMESKTLVGPQPKVRVDTRLFVSYARKRKLFYRTVRAMMRATGQPCLSIDYEDIGDTQCLKRVVEFVGATPDVHLQAKTRQQNSPRLSDRIENYAEVEKALAGTPYFLAESDR